MFQKLNFGPDAIAFIRLQLSTRGTFWQMLCDLPLEMGRVSAFLPPAATPKDLLHFAWHLNVRKDLEAGSVDWEYREREREFVADYFQQGHRAAIFRGETQPPPRGGPRQIGGAIRGLTLTRSFPNTYSSEVPTITDVYYLLAEPADPKQVLEGYDSMERMPLLGALASLPATAELPGNGQEVDRDFLQWFAGRTECILCSAFGNDATLIWTCV